MDSEKKPFHAAVAEKLIEQLRAGTAPWQKPWEPGAELPFNPVTGKRYRGINALQLMSEVRADPRWLTYKQAQALEAQVRRGEKGTPIQYWQFTEEQPVTDAGGRPVRDARGEPVTQTVKLERPRVFFATVFNAEQVDGLAPLTTIREHAWDPVERAERILHASGAVVQHGEHDRAFYRPLSDSIHLPARAQFPAAGRYYATALHELGHWTGHAERLNRDLAHPFGSEGYAREELRAEIASMILGNELGIGHDTQQHAAYVGSWIKVLQDDPLEIFRAAAEAEKIRDFVLGLEQRQLQELQGQEHANAPQPHPAAFLDTSGALRDWDSGDALAAEWQGVVKHRGAYWFVGQQAGERSFTVLAATGYAAAEAEAARVRALAVDIAAVLDGSAAAFADFKAFDGESLALALRSRGLATVGDVTGADTVQFVVRAEERLLPVFAEAERHGTERADRERKELARAFAHRAQQLVAPQQQTMEAEMETTQEAAGSERAAQWTVTHLERGTLPRALDRATLAQLHRVEQVLAAMRPLEPANPFWQEHPLPQDVDAFEGRLFAAHELVGARQADALVAAARLKLVTGQAFGRERAGDADDFDREAESAFGFRLPRDWTGQVRVREAASSSPENGWAVCVQRESDVSFEPLAQRATRAEADVLAERMAWVDAHSTLNEHEKAAKLARLHEQRLRRDPHSTEEDLAAAKEARKRADLAATLHDEDLQRRIEHAQRDLAQQAASGSQRTLIAVPYKEKDEAKALGARWDRQRQSWYVPAGVDIALFAKWPQQQLTGGGQVAAAGEAGGGPPAERVYLAVPYSERTAARAAGARWDKVAKSWCAGPDADMAALGKWKTEHVPVQQAPAMTPREEFAEFLQSVGCVISGDHPIMDGKKHRITVEGEKHSRNSGSGFYVGHMDGHPAGYAKNNKTGVEGNWKAKGYALDPQQKAVLAAEAAAKLQQREADLARVHEQAAARVAAQVAKLVPVVTPTPYMAAKGIGPQPGALTDEEGRKTYLPAIDSAGRQWTMQYIQENGTKRFAKDSRKEGCFHVVGEGLDELARAPAVVIGEGYATAASLRQALGFATVSAFDSGNLVAVAFALHEKYPDKPIVIAGDDDRHLELTQGVNPGRIKAEEAAQLVGGKVLLPIFAPGENAYPDGLAPVTPKLYRQHQRSGDVLSEEQLEALAHMKEFTDFNDLANKSELGLEGIERQVRAAVAGALASRSSVDVDQRRELEEQAELPDQQQAAEVVVVPEQKPKRQRKSASVA
jgi:antirestriction protein ArdC/phage/plasmid primase-like uncharacterized protein